MSVSALQLRSSRPRSGLTVVVVAGLVGISGVLASQAGFAARAAVGLLGLVIFVFVAASNRRLALVSAITWLIFLGFVRRLLIPFVGWSPHDPLLLVSPATAAVLLLVSMRRSAPPRLTPMSAIATVLLLLSLAEVLNPNETSFTVSLQALLFYVTPLLWFFVGQRLTLDEHSAVTDVMLWASVPVLALGYYHSFVGLLPFEYHWLGVSGQSAAIFLPGFKIRPFSTFSSPQEYGYFLAFVLPVVLGVLFAATAFGLILQSSRTVFIFLLLAVFAMTIVRVRSLPTVLLGIALAASVGLLAVHTQSSPTQAPPSDASQAAAAHRSSASNLISHEFAGLSHPGQGTGPLHITLIAHGFEQGFHDPFGLGISHGTIASLKAGTPAAAAGAGAVSQESEQQSAENDLANFTAAAGIPGGVALGLFILAGLAGALRLYNRRPGPVALAWLGMGIVALTQWLAGGLYATSTIFFVALGGISALGSAPRLGAQRQEAPELSRLR
jgi:hypothetical protein